MDWKTFVSNMAGSLAWPTAGAFAAWFFRAEIKHCLQNIRKVGAAGISFEVADLIEKSGERLEQAVPPESKKVPAAKRDYLLVEEFPEAAVMQAYQELAEILLKLRAQLPDDKPHRNLIEVVNWLTKNGHVPESIRESFIALQRTATLVKHGKGADRIAPGEAMEIVRQLAVLTDVFANVVDRLPRRSQRP
jgi:hypothetical protein